MSYERKTTQGAIDALLAFDHSSDTCRIVTDLVADLTAAEHEIERLRRICRDSFMTLPVPPGPAMAFVDSDITPHVRAVADEYAVLRAQVDAFRSGERDLLREIERLRAALKPFANRASLFAAPECLPELICNIALADWRRAQEMAK